jgi:uncharacterized protein involved in outer membrane biogenesis
MGKLVKWLALLLLALLLVLAAVAFALQRWVNSDDFRSRIEQQASAQLGLPVKAGRLEVNVFPLPAVAVENLSVQSRPAIALERVEARPVWTALLAGRLEIATLVVRGATLPQQGVDAVIASVQKRSASSARAAAATPAPDAGASTAALALIPRRTLLDGVTWVSERGVPMTMDADVRLDDDGLPGAVDFKVIKGNFQDTSVKLDRSAQGWQVDAKVGGGTLKGLITLGKAQPGAKGPQDFILQGSLATRGVEVSALTAPSRTLTGRLDADTSFRAQFRDIGGLAEAMQTQTKFTVNGAVIHGLDLLKAVSTIGLSRGGETRLDTLAGQVVTSGRAVQLNNLVANSGRLAASGNVAISPSKALSGRLSVDAGSKLVGIPLEVSGTLDSPQVGLSRSALIGAAIGSALAPGPGTAAGASVGDRLGTKLKGLFNR